MKGIYMAKTLQIHAADNVVVCLESIVKGEVVHIEGVGEITALDKIEPGHKIAIKNINNGEELIKYGYPIGHATEDIKAGRWVHTPGRCRPAS